MKSTVRSTPLHQPETNALIPALALVVTLSALALRLYHLGTESLWVDEGFSLRDSTQFTFIGNRPLYFILLHAWRLLGMSHSEFMLRLPSALFGTAGVWLLYILGQRLVGAPSALLASVFMAISVAQIDHSREVRMYSMTVFFALLSTYYLVLALDRGSARYAVAYVVTAMATLLTFPLTILVFAAHGLFALLYSRTYRLASALLVGSQLSVAAAWGPWMLTNLRDTAAFSESYASTLPKPTLSTVPALLGKFFLLRWSDPGTAMALGAFGFSILVTALALYGLRSFRRTDAGLAFAWLWLIIPMSALIVVSHQIANMWREHYLIAFAPAFFLLVARGILSMRSRYAIAGAVAAVTIVTLGRLGLYYTKPNRPEWRTAVNYIRSHERPGDVIGVYYAGNRHVFGYYYDGPSRWAPLGSEEIRKEDFGRWSDARIDRMFAQYRPSGRRFWLVLSNHTYAGGFDIIDYAKRHYRELDHQNYHLLEIYLFDAPGSLVPGSRPSAEPREQPSLTAARTR